MARHRRATGASGVRTASLLTAGALAGGAAIAAVTIPWSDTAPLPSEQPPERPPEQPPGDRAEAPPAGPPVAVPEPRLAEEAPRVTDVSAPAPPRPTPVRWRAHGEQAFRTTRSNPPAAAAPRVEHGEVVFHVDAGVRRSEVEPDLPAADEGDAHLTVFSLRLDHGPSGAPADHVVMRWDNDGPGAAPVDLRVRDGRLVLHGGEGHPSGSRTAGRDLGHAPEGEWTRLAVRVHFSANPDKGSVSVHRDGRTVVAHHRPPGGTLYPGQRSHLTAGVRRESASAHPPTVRLRDWHVAGVRSTGTSSTPSTPSHRGEAHSRTSSHGDAGRHARGSEARHGHH